MKKNEDAAAKKKPKVSAAQIRVQKGAFCTLLADWPLMAIAPFRLDRARPSLYYANELP